MWIGRIFLLGWLSAYISGFFMEPISHRNYYVAIARKEITSIIKIFTIWNKIYFKKFMKRVLNSN